MWIDNKLHKLFDKLLHSMPGKKERKFPSQFDIQKRIQSCNRFDNSLGNLARNQFDNRIRNQFDIPLDKRFHKFLSKFARHLHTQLHTQFHN